MDDGHHPPPYSAALSGPEQDERAEMTTSDDGGHDDLADDDGGEDEGGGESSGGEAGDGVTADGERPAGKKRRRRRRRGRGRGGEAADGAAPSTGTIADATAGKPAEAKPVTAQDPHGPRAQGERGPKPAHDRDRGGRAHHDRGHRAHHDRAGRASQPARESTPTASPQQVAAFAQVAAGLFSHLDDREVPCRLDGCGRTWTWTAAEQIQAFGQPPPRRLCPEHHAAFESVADTEVRCSNPGCERTWTWTKAAQLAVLQRGGTLEPPTRACDECAHTDRNLGDTEIACRVDGCKRTWTWTRDAQLKHRAWLRHTAAEAPEPPPAGDRRGRRRRRGRNSDGPPPRMCEPCRQRQAKLVDREAPCKVHGCTRTVTIDRESQLRAWAATGTTDIDADVPMPKRMCEVCREFCRLHTDREVACGRPGCDRTWTYKTGAQLQAFLAGRFEDPLRLCAQCIAGGHAQAPTTIEGAETMPCVVPLCDGIWHYVVGMSIAPANDGDHPVDRMCDRCRAERGEAPRPTPRVSSNDDARTLEPDEPDDASTHVETSPETSPEPSPETEPDEGDARLDASPTDEAHADDGGALPPSS